ncbi:bifunctional methylenetetrahydrofolate dehydrogenase/methenyltetrahydrofolate cyclohydrolase, partial [Mycobacterium tuberculosis]|nr:bifunctional methylenetetrahydrofolate dehydrogenase/methenyltetrahydrofolate cyclohydrolase [Mycobacterium tuberculosis]
PYGSMMLLDSIHPKLSGLDAVVIGRSVLVGRPMAQRLLRASCTVTMAHSRPRNIADVCRRADSLVAAVGIAGFVKPDWVK